MIERRPTLPTGYSLAGLPAVAKVLHSNRKCELYSLFSPDARQTALLLLLSPDMSSETRRVTDWLNAQHPRVLRVLRVLTAEECPANATGFMLELRGCSIADDSLKAVDEDRIRRLLHSMLDLIERGQSVRMYPDLIPSLSWKLDDEGVLCTLLPLNERPLSELDQVRLVAKAFYWFATGIEPEQLKGNVPPLVRWSKFVGEELSRIVDRCLAPTNSKESITTLIGLNNALGRLRTKDIPQGHDLSRSSTPQ